MNLISKILNIGVHPDLDEFKASQYKTFNRILTAVLLAYAGIIFTGFYIDSLPVIIYIPTMTLLLFPAYTLMGKGKDIAAAYWLVINAWVLIAGLTIYLGLGGGNVFALITGSIIIFIIFEKPLHMILAQSINLTLALSLVWYSSTYGAIWEGDQNLLFPIKVAIIFFSIATAIATIASFKINNYRFVTLVHSQKKIIQRRQEDIQASIQYAQYIQFGLLPERADIDDFNPNNFVLFKPKEQVSGDLFWTHRIKDKSFLALGDCTGHGIPGAMVSILALSLLETIIAERKIDAPSDLLNELDKEFSAKMSRTNLNDGMDISVVMFNHNTEEWSFSGANNSIITCSAEESLLVKGAKRAIGDAMTRHIPFKDVSLELKDGDNLFLYSDGFRDQFGGEKRKKFGMKRFQELLVSIAPLDNKKQMIEIEKSFKNWINDLEQIDDISLIGLKV